MQVKKYFYKTANLYDEQKATRVIKETLEHRDEYMNEVFFEMFKDDITSFKTTGKTALLYIGGACEHHSTARNFNLSPKGVMPVKSQLGYIASKTAKRVGNISFLSINSNACASSLYALKEAQILLNSGFDDVIIYGEEWVEDVELKLFKQLNIDVVCSDGFFIIQLVNKCDNPKATIEKDVNFIWCEDRSPFEVSAKGYLEAMKPFKDVALDMVKMHGSGTPQNSAAELVAVKELFGDIETIEYKSKIGHSQGISTGLELCLLLEEYKNKSILVNSSGLGNFYGSCYVRL